MALFSKAKELASAFKSMYLFVLLEPFTNCKNLRERKMTILFDSIMQISTAFVF